MVRTASRALRMTSLDTLPPDQRAVLDLVLRRGRSYDDIAQLLAIDRAAVRARALAAFDVLGPETGIAAESRALITDYLLGQLPSRVAEHTRARLADQPYERAWARRVASQLESVASGPLPEIPDGSRAREAPSAEADATASATSTPAESAPTIGREPRRARSRERRPRRTPRLSDRPASRRGGAIMLGVGVLVVVALVVVLVSVLGGGSSKRSPTTSAGSPPTTAGTTSTASTSSTSNAQVVAQINLNPPTGAGATKGIGFVVRAGSAYGIIIEGQNIAANNHNFYAAWLYNSPTDSHLLGFVNPPVGKTGKLQVSSPLPSNAGHFKQLLLTLETQATPKSPGHVVLQGPFKGVPPPASG